MIKKNNRFKIIMIKLNNLLQIKKNKLIQQSKKAKINNKNINKQIIIKIIMIQKKINNNNYNKN